MRTIRSLLLSLLRALFHPVVLISLFGPLILSVNLITLRDGLSFPYGETTITGPFTELKTVLSNVWVYALVDYNAQLYTLMLAWIIFYVDVCGVGIKLVQRHSGAGVSALFKNSTISLCFAICVAMMFFLGIWSFFSGALSGPDIVAYYLPNGLHISGGIRIPPFESHITWFRGLITVFGFLLSLWEEKNLPSVIRASSE